MSVCIILNVIRTRMVDHLIEFYFWANQILSYKFAFVFPLSTVKKDPNWIYIRNLSVFLNIFAWVSFT